MSDAKILLVDDEMEFLDVLSERLGKRGFKAVNVSSGWDALELLKKQADFEVVVLDFRMPGMDGLETLKKIKEINPLVEVIILTGFSTVESGVEGMKFGAFDYLSKPCEIEKLTTKIKEAAALKWKHENDLVTVRSNPPHAQRRVAETMDPAVRRALGFLED